MVKMTCSYGRLYELKLLLLMFDCFLSAVRSLTIKRQDFQF